jgi:hypothetical protein
MTGLSGRPGSSDCTRTHTVIARVVDGSVSADDRAHAATCASCGPVLARAQRFDDELRRSARSLVVEDLPAGILEPGVGPGVDGFRVRRSVPGLAPAAALVVILLLATTVAIGPGSNNASPTPESPGPSLAATTPGKSPSAATGYFRRTDQIRADLAKLDWTCNDGMPLDSVEPGPNAVVRESAVCTAPETVGKFMAAVLIGEAARGEVVEYGIKADLLLEDSPSVRDGVALALAKALALAPLERGDGPALSAWLTAKLPALVPGERVDIDLAGFNVSIERLSTTGGWLVHAVPLWAR